MFIGTTGSDKTTELNKLVTQARTRGHRCVIFDLTGSFVESFFNPETDTILNTMDTRCKPWTIFSDCDNYVEFLSGATALIPSGHNAEDDFWQKAARIGHGVVARQEIGPWSDCPDDAETASGRSRRSH